MSEKKEKEIEKEVKVDGELFEDEEKESYSSPPLVAETSRPKDPRSKAKYNVFSRLLFW